MLRSFSLATCALAPLAVLPAPAWSADLPLRSAPPALVVPPAFTWTGLYLGVNAGGIVGRGGGDFVDPTFGQVASTGSDGAAFAGGAQVGYNYQFAPGGGLVVGLEADIQGVAGGSRGTYALGAVPYLSLQPSLDWFGTVRGRIGWAFDRLLVYGTGGLAYGGGSRPAAAAAFPLTLPDTTWTGYAVGGGVEYAFTPNITGRIEGLYVDLGRSGTGAAVLDATVPVYLGSPRQDERFGLVRAGVNYRF